MLFIHHANLPKELYHAERLVWIIWSIDEIDIIGISSVVARRRLIGGQPALIGGQPAEAQAATMILLDRSKLQTQNRIVRKVVN